MTRNAPIGIFDSGIGGLTIAKAVKELLPNEQIIYFGDTLHLPYGEKSPASIKRYSEKISRFMARKGCKAVLIACNSASSVAFDTTVNALPKDTIVLNVIDPLVDFVKQKFKNQTVGVIGTKATINSGVYQHKLRSSCEVKALTTPLLAPMIEEGFFNDKISSTIIEEYLTNDALSNIKALLLGCTHYPIIHSEIESIYGRSVQVLDSNLAIAASLKTALIELNLTATELTGPDEFYVSDLTTSFELSTRFFFGKKIQLEQLVLG